MNIFVVGATGSIGRLVVESAIRMGHHVKALVRNNPNARMLPPETELIYGDVSYPETLAGMNFNVDAVIFTLGSNGQGRIGARAIDYGGVRNVLRILKNKTVDIVLMTTIGVTDREGNYNRQTEAHDWKRRAERLVRASGHPYTIVRPGWFDYNKPDEHKITMLQGDRRHSGTPADGAISRDQIARVLISSAMNKSAQYKTFELVAEKGSEQPDLTPVYEQLIPDSHNKLDALLDMNNMPLENEPECFFDDLDEISGKKY